MEESQVEFSENAPISIVKTEWGILTAYIFFLGEEENMETARTEDYVMHKRRWKEMVEVSATLKELKNGKWVFQILSSLN